MGKHAYKLGGGRNKAATQYISIIRYLAWINKVHTRRQYCGMSNICNGTQASSLANFRISFP